jgi:hypothetical protein
MVAVQGIHVSGNHYLRDQDGMWIRADAYSAAIPAPSIARLWCLGTSTNRIPVVSRVGDMEFTDFEESSDEGVIAAAQRTAEEGLNGPGRVGPTVPDYSLGIDPTFNVLMQNGSWKQASQLRVGDGLSAGGRIVGIVHEQCEELCISPCGHTVSAAQLVYWGTRWQRAAHIWPRAPGDRAQTLVQVLLDSARPFIVGAEGEMYSVRDYTEWEETPMQALYDAALAKK